MFDSVFFFFKQKTAYEMRISDWSSDVCSSDLGPTIFKHQPTTDNACQKNQCATYNGIRDQLRFPLRRIFKFLVIVSSGVIVIIVRISAVVSAIFMSSTRYKRLNCRWILSEIGRAHV